MSLPELHLHLQQRTEPLPAIKRTPWPGPKTEPQAAIKQARPGPGQSALLASFKTAADNLGREQDGTETLAKAQAHWQQVKQQSQKELRRAKGERRQVIRRRIEAAEKRLAVIAVHLQLLARAEAERKRRQQQAEEAVYWQSFERLRRQPTQETAAAARRAFLFLAKRHHPDAGGTHHGFLRVKEAYDRALTVWQRLAS